MSGGPVAAASRIGVTFALLLFAALALASGFDRMSAVAPALGRYVPAPLRAQAARANATLALTRQQPRNALVSARKAVAADPVDPASAALLGTVELMNGRPSAAEAAFRVAARFGWREPMTQVYWDQAAFQSGDLPRAVERADALLRAHPGVAVRDLLLEPLVRTAEGPAALVVRMADRPIWLDDYLLLDGADDAEAARRSLVLTELSAAGTRLGCGEVTPFVRQMVARGARREAERVWVGHCPGATLSQGLADGGFERFGRESAAPFGWTTVPSGDVGVEPVAAAGGGRAVRLSNRGTVSRLVLRQAVSLEPGLYRLTGKVAPGRVSASLGCGEAPPRPDLAAEDLAAGGQVLRVESCSRLELGLWLRPGPEDIELDSVMLRRMD
jgi:hypothetical protein